MALETSVEHIADLNPLWPTSTDPKSAGDDNLRNLKTALLNCFAGFAGAVIVTGTDGGAANAYTVTPSTAIPSYDSRMAVIFSPNAANTGASTLNISGLGVKALKAVDGTALASGDLVVGMVYVAIYNGTEFRLSSITKNYIDQIVVSGILPGADNPANAGKFYTTNGTSGSWSDIDTDSIGVVTIDKGNSGLTAQVLNYAAAESQKLTITGNCAISTANWPAGRTGHILLKLVNGGAYTLTWSGITWVKAGGTLTTNFNLSGVTLQSAGTDFILFWSDDGGTTVYAKVIR